ncbi:EAL domain-containing protein (plasmid) [Agrobacterium leguminum]|uniref:EAL domain-containing protein n=1 Tax=Agrobacterium leguminum TaxID=2792015 RepID=UPI00272D6A2E|nr:EAL domain-containing protein [Agrobacterium leguminum]WLE00558.1 EAL domain-containing protein [Agrobacterium leguminum]
MMKPVSSFSVTVDNLQQIAVAYSDAVAMQVLYEVWKRLSSIFGTEMWSVCQRSWGVSLDFCGNDVTNSFRADAIEVALVTASQRPVAIGMHMIVPSLGISFGEIAYPEASVALNASQYRLDMCAAALVYSALDAGNMHFAEQPVTRCGGHAETLYHECLARLIDDDGGVILTGTYLGALERLGLVRVFDRQVMREVLRQLHSRPDVVLGCNISGLSVVRDIWWTSIIDELTRFPDVAERLVIEITETAPLPDVVDALALITALRRTGARVALDDFGVGNSSLSFAREARVDIIKIDRSFVRDHETGDGGQHRLRHLIGLVRDFTAAVVVEGIESAADLRAAADAGADWFQGYYFQRPALPEHASDRVVCLEAGRLY